MRLGVLIALFVIVVALIWVLYIPKQQQVEMVPNLSIRNKVSSFTSKQIKEIVFDGVPGGLKSVTEENDKRNFQSAMKKAEKPKDIGNQPTNQTMSIKFILNDERVIGPFWFSYEGPEYAFGVEFARTFNDYSRRYNKVQYQINNVPPVK